MTDDAEIQAQRERVLDAIRELDRLYNDGGLYPEARTDSEILTHALVVMSWHRVDGSGVDSSSITHFRLTDMPEWQVLGLCEAMGAYARHTLTSPRDDD